MKVRLSRKLGKLSSEFHTARKFSPTARSLWNAMQPGPAFLLRPIASQGRSL